MDKKVHPSNMDATDIGICWNHTDIFKIDKKVHLSEMDFFPFWIKGTKWDQHMILNLQYVSHTYSLQYLQSICDYVLHPTPTTTQNHQPPTLATFGTMDNDGGATSLNTPRLLAESSCQSHIVESKLSRQGTTIWGDGTAGAHMLHI